MNIKIDKEKRVFFIIGSMGSGKTVLAKQLKKKLGRTIVLDDFGYHSINPLRRIGLVSLIAKARHLNKKIITNITYYKTIPKRYEFKDNHIIAWLFTSMEAELFNDLIEMGVDSYYLTKQRKAYIYAISKKRKTRPFLYLTLEKDKKTIHHEIHRYKLK